MNDETMHQLWREWNAADKALRADIAERGDKPGALKIYDVDDHLAWWAKRDALVRRLEWWRDLIIYRVHVQQLPVTPPSPTEADSHDHE